MSENNNGIGVFAGFVAGAVVGAGLALLMAPASGTETRQRLRSKAEDLSGKARELGDSARERMDAVGQVVRDGSRDIGNAMKEGREAVKDGRDALKDTASEALATVRRG